MADDMADDLDETLETQTFCIDETDSVTTTPAGATGRHAAAMLIPVIPTDPPSSGTAFQPPPLAAFRVTTAAAVVVGRGADVQVQIADRRISSKHCTIEMSDDHQGVRVTDTSANGTFVNGSRIDKGTAVLLPPSAVLALVNPAMGDIVSFVANYTLPPSMSAAAGSASKRRKIDGATSDAPIAGAAAAAAAAVPATSSATDEAEAELLECCVCREVLHGVVTVLPCLHNFCGACLTEWQKNGSTECPSCRGPCSDVRRNHQFKTVVDEFLDRNPHRRRTAEELSDMDKRDKYTNENLRVRPAAQPAHHDDDDSDRSIDDDSDISIADDDVQNLCVCVCVPGAPLSVAPSRLRHLTRCQPCPRNTLSVVTNVTLPPTRRDRPMAFAVTTTTRFTSGALLATNSCRTE
eukprot:m.44007 g.44007  ORF g.44007 m.44007 type:complete len:407 (-) comp14881_c0_seq2:935-2155(-)